MSVEADFALTTLLAVAVVGGGVVALLLLPWRAEQLDQVEAALAACWRWVRR